VWRFKSFLLYDEIAELVDGALASGDYSFTPGHALPVSRGASEPWDIQRLDQNLTPNGDNDGDNGGDNGGDNSSDNNDDNNYMIDPTLRDTGPLYKGEDCEAAAGNDIPSAVSGDDPTFNAEAPVVSPLEPPHALHINSSFCSRAKNTSVLYQIHLPPQNWSQYWLGSVRELPMKVMDTNQAMVM
jgi:hypothetical protein